MEEIRNLDGKRVCGIRHNAGIVEIVKKDCVTRIYMSPKGTIQVTHERITTVA